MGVLTITSQPFINPTSGYFLATGICQLITGAFEPVWFTRNGIPYFSGQPIVGDLVYQDAALTQLFDGVGAFRVKILPDDLVYDVTLSISSGQIQVVEPCRQPDLGIVLAVNPITGRFSFSGADGIENITIRFTLNSSDNTVNTNRFNLYKNLQPGGTGDVSLGLGNNSQDYGFTSSSAGDEGGLGNDFYSYLIEGNTNPIVTASVVARSSGLPFGPGSTITIVS